MSFSRIGGGTDWEDKMILYQKPPLCPSLKGNIQNVNDKVRLVRAQRRGWARTDTYESGSLMQQIGASEGSARQHSAGHPRVHQRRHGGGGAPLPLHVRMPPCNGGRAASVSSAVTSWLGNCKIELNEWMRMLHNRDWWSVPMFMSNPRFLSSRNSWQSAQHSQQQWTQQSAQGLSWRPYCARILAR